MLEAEVGGQAKLAKFYHLWALKECFIKATGEGLVEDLGAIEFDFSAGVVMIFFASVPGTCPQDLWFR